MKYHHIICFLLLLAVVFLVCGCDSDESANCSGFYDGSSCSELEESVEEESVVITQPLDGIWETFAPSSLEDFLEWWDENNAESPVQQKKYANGVEFYRLTQYLSDEQLIKYPCLNGEAFPLDEQTPGYPMITIFPNERFDLPWIWFTGDINGKYIKLCTLYLNCIESVELNGEETASEIIQKLAPNFPNLHNQSEHTDSYNAIYTSKIKISEKDTDVLIYEYAKYSQVDIIFIYENMLVRVFVRVNSLEDVMGIFDEAFWNALSFESPM